MSQFPNFSLLGHDGKTYSLKDFSGKKVVIYFYPKDDTPGCTIEAKEFRDTAAEFEQENTVIIGISSDSRDKHCQFIEKYNLNFLLLVDAEKELVQALGIWKEKSMFGKKHFGVLRTTYVLDENGNIVHIWEKVTPLGHAKKVLQCIREM